VNPVAVMIPTLRRPESLERALNSVLQQVEGAVLIREIVVVDNSPEASARSTVEAIQARAPLPIRFVHCPVPGVATARNAGLKDMDSPYVAFLDDDEEARPDWLARLYAAHQRYEADVTFSPVEGRIPDRSHWACDYLERFFSRIGPEASGPIDTVYGCGASMMTRATALRGPAPFDPEADQIGGEDDRLFTQLRNEGRRFAWAADAVVLEHAPAARANLRYALRRAVSYGKTPAEICASQKDWLGVVRWMAIGAVQTLVYGVAAGVAFLLKLPRRADLADRAARGVGKLTWMQPIAFYGTASVS
jgi:glycosyltransferase involved in cell wall biosynthesis